VNREQKPERDHGADQIGGDHHAAPVQPVEHHARHRPGDDHGQRARQHDAGDGQP